MMTADVNLNEFNRGLARYQSQLGLDSVLVMKKELAELVKTLVKVSPPKDRSKSMRVAKTEVEAKFTGLREQSNAFGSVDIQEGKTGLKYWAANKKFLFAGAADSDMTKASLNELRAVHYAARKQSGSYRLVVPFRNPRKLQRVAITTKILTKEKQVRALGAKIASNFGRLKAAWMSPVRSGAVSLAGKFNPPMWVTRHSNAKSPGKFINQLSQKDNPSFTIINRAKGVTGKTSTFYVGLALRIRAKAMKKNAEMILAGKKEYTY